MKRSWWRTGPPVMHTQPGRRPTLGQVSRQIGVLLAMVAVWGGALLVLLGATRSSNVAFVVDRSTPVPKATSAVATATSAATDTPTPEAVAAAVAPAGTVTMSVSFARDVLPIFNQICVKQICVKCHGGENPLKSLVLKTYDDLMQGSEDGSVVESGDPGNSLLIDMIVKGKMPKNGPKLLPKQIRAIVDWVTAGAPDN